MQHREAKLMNNNVLLLAISVDSKHSITINKEQLKKGKRAVVNIAIDMRNFSKISETCENTPFILSVRKKLLTASLSDDELDFEKQLAMQAKRQQLEKENSDEPNFDAAFRESFGKALVEMEKIDRSFKLTVLQAIDSIEHYPQIV